MRIPPARTVIDAADRILAHPVMDGYLRSCLYVGCGLSTAMVAFLAMVVFRVCRGLPPVPRAGWVMGATPVLAGVAGAVLAFALHRMVRRRFWPARR